MRRLLLSLLIICCSSGTAFAAAKTPLTQTVTAIKPDGSLVLSSSGNAALADMLFPDAALAENWLAEHALQKQISFKKAEDEDRYGRMLITSDIEAPMLRDGAAIFYARNDKIPAEWMNAETTARNAKRGIWTQKDFLLTPENAAQHRGEFHVLEGRISRIYEAKNATYLNFGEDWHSDFSITIPGKTRRGMKEMLQQLKPGSAIRIRGMIYEENGPMIKLLKADNLEIR